MAAGGPAVGAASAAPAAGPFETYDLVDTWESRPWQLTPGHVFLPADVTTTPDGRAFVLDSRPQERANELPAYAHAFASDGSPVSAFALTSGAQAVSIDAAGDGSLYVLRRDAFSGWSVEHWSADGQLSDGFALPDDSDRADLAVAPDGRIYVLKRSTSHGESYVPNSIDVYDAAGQLLLSVDSEQFFPVDHTVDPHYHIVLNRIDVDPSGRAYVAVEFVGGT